MLKLSTDKLRKGRIQVSQINRINVFIYNEYAKENVMRLLKRFPSIATANFFEKIYFLSQRISLEK